jgi:hypothetical protein
MEGLDGPDNSNDGNNFEFNLPEGFLGDQKPSNEPVIPKFNFDQIIELSDSITVRRADSEDGWERFIGVQRSALDDARRSTAKTMEQSLLLQRLEDPNVVINNAEAIDDSVGLYSQNLLEKGVYETKGEADAHAKGFVRHLKSTTSPEDDLAQTEEFKAELIAVSQIAELEDTTITEVYNNDALYKRTLQALYPPQELADKAMTLHEIEQVAGVDPDVIDNSAQDIKTEAIYSTIHIHGISGLDSLPDEYKDALGISDGGISEEIVRGAPQLPDPQHQREADVLRTAFAKSYCAKFGWNPNKLEQNEIDAIKEQRTWKDPLGLAR